MKIRVKVVCSFLTLSKTPLPFSNPGYAPASDSTIGLHLLQNSACAQHYDDSRFFILALGRSPFHLSAFEAIFIKTSNPVLHRQKRIH